MRVGNARRWVMRSYPPQWRARYEEEMLALIDDTLGEEPPSLRFCLAMVRAGLTQRLRGGGVIGDDLEPADQSRSGSLVVLCAWSCFALAGMIFAKFSEHWQDATPRGLRSAPVAVFTVLQASAAISAVLIVVGGLAAAPALARLVRERGWSDIRRPLRPAAMSAIALAAVTAALIFANHQVGSHTPNLPWLLGLLFVAWELLGALTLASTTAALVTVARQLDLSVSVVRSEAALAAAVASGMVLVTVATSVWWMMIAARASWVLSGGPTGTKAPPWSATMAFTELVMLGACVVASMGVVQIRRAAVRHESAQAR